MKTLRKVLALLLMATMLLSLGGVVFATGTDPEPDPEPTDTTEPTPTTVVELQKEETKIPVILGSGVNASYEGHMFKAFKIMDLYKVVNTATDPDTQLVDEEGNPIFQYKLVLADTLPADFESLLERNGFAFDTVTGEITLGTGAAITSMAGENENSSDAARLAALIAGYIVENGLGGTELTLGTETELECGYWVIYETDSGEENDGTVATKPILLDLRPVAADGSAVTQRNVSLKDAKVEVEKTVYEQPAAEAQIGTKLPYTITTNLPVYEANVDPDSVKFVVTDTLSAGLTYVEESFAITIGRITEPAAYVDDDTAWDYKFVANGQTLTITVNPETVVANQGEAVTITYRAMLNENAIVNSTTGNKNDVTVEYSNNPMVDEDSTKTVETDSTVYTYAFDLSKLDGSEGDDFLAGAKFVLTRRIGGHLDPAHPSYQSQTFDFDKVTEGGHTTYVVKPVYNEEGVLVNPHFGGLTADSYIITESTGTITVKGLDEGTYYLNEIEAPEGYAKLAEPIVITVTAVLDEDGNPTGNATISVENGSVLVDGATEETVAGVTVGDGSSNVKVIVRNYKGISLPETGSIGALIVTALGAAAAMGGAVISRKRRDEE